MSIFEKFFKADASRAAIDEAKKRVQENPQNADAWVALGDALAGAKQYKEAGACYMKAFGLEPRSNILWRAGSMLVMMGEYNKAIELFEEMTANYPKMSSAWASLALAYSDAQRWQDAIHAATKATEISPDLNLSAIVGRSYLNLKDYTNALPHLKRAAESEPDDASNWLAFGRCLNELEKLDDALAALTKSTEINPRDGQVWVELSSLHLKQGDSKNAVAAMERAARTDPKLRKVLPEMKRDLLRKDAVHLDAPKGYKQSPQEWLYSFVQFFLEHHEIDSVTDAFMLGLPLYDETFVSGVEKLAKNGSIKGSVMVELLVVATANNLVHVYRNYIAKGKSKREIRAAFEESARLMLKGHESMLH